MTAVAERQAGELVLAYRPVFEELEREGIRYCLLRGDPWTGAGLGDADLLVHPEEGSRVHAILSRLGFVGRARAASPYKTVYVDYRDGQAACLDLHEEIVQDGLVYMDRDRALARRVRRGGIHVLSDEDLLLHLVWHHLLRRTATPPGAKDRIRALLRHRLDREYMRQQLDAFGLADPFERACRLVTADEEPLAERLRLRREFRLAVCRHRRGNRRTHLGFRLRKWRVRRRRGGLVALVGPDGVGKSTILAAIEERARALRGLRVEAVYLGPWGRLELPLIKWLRKAGFTPCMEPWGLWLAARLGLRGDAGPSPARTYSSGYLLSKWVRSLGKGTLFYAAIYAELLYRYFRGVFLQKLRGRWVVADRYITDLRYLYKGNPIQNYRLLRFLVVRLFPRPDLFVLLDNTPDVIHGRKGDLTVEQLRVFRELYRRAIAGYRHEVVTTDRPPQEVSDRILRRMVHLAAQR